MGVAEIITALLGAGVVASFVTWLLGRHKPKIERQAAVESTQRTMVEMADSVAERALSLAEATSGRVDELKSEVEEYKVTVGGQSVEIGHLKHSLRTLTFWAQDVVARWDVIRLEKSPPQLPPMPTAPTTPGDRD